MMGMELGMVGTGREERMRAKHEFPGENAGCFDRRNLASLDHSVGG